jgi:predicted nuclease of restriction endonuclease-like (RecB) superfamily
MMDNTPNTPAFFENVAQINEQARAFVGRTADRTMCVTYFEVGRMIVEEEQGGKARAEYGKGLLAGLSNYLNGRVGKGFSESTLRNARKFYQVYAPSIQQTMFAELGKGQTLTALFDDPQKGQTMFAESYPFTLGWSHYLILMRIENEQERRFYEIEATRQQWTFRQLGRQRGSSLYERLALSRNKDEVMRLAREGQTIEKPRDVLKNPLVLEFLNMDEKAEYSESDLETAIIGKLSHFLLELGKGFLFEARQKRFTFDEDHFMVDLVFYNRLLQCYVLIDLKTDKLKHQDLGQMLMYVNYFDRYVKTDTEKPTVGILLCKEKNDSIVELTLPEDSNIYASEYSLYLPDKALLQRKLAEWVEEFEEEHGGEAE